MKLEIFCISARRAENVKKVEEKMGVSPTWVVAEGETEAYTTNGASKVIEGGSLCASRNAALRAAFATGSVCVQVSDDLTKVIQVPAKGAKGIEISFTNCLREMETRLKQTPFKMCGVAPVANEFYFHTHTSHKNFIIGDLIMVKPCDLFFDENLSLKEDYDYTLQHITKFGGALRCNDLLCGFKHRDNKGGAVAYRTAEKEQEAIAYLKNKWGKVIRDNPRRPNEILLKV